MRKVKNLSQTIVVFQDNQLIG
ncbi:unnamed protein product, partial [Rotaria sp. Silwood2]